jgi:hypothetical protein
VSVPFLVRILLLFAVVEGSAAKGKGENASRDRKSQGKEERWSLMEAEAETGSE